MSHLVQESSCAAHRAGRHRQVREGIPGMRVRAVLRDEEVRPECCRDGWNDRVDRSPPGVFTSEWLERNVRDRPRRGPGSHLIDEAGARKQIPARFMEGDREDTRVRGVNRLHPVAVVDIEVDVEDPQAGPSSSRDRQCRIVVDTEARRPVGHCMVKATARVEGMLRLSAQDRFHRLK